LPSRHEALGSAPVPTHPRLQKKRKEEKTKKNTNVLGDTDIFKDANSLVSFGNRAAMSPSHSRISCQEK
jgi:hypothetical protein